MKDDEETGSDLDQMVAIIEKSEISYTQEDGDDDGDGSETIIDVNDTVRMVFDEDGNLLEINPIPN